MAMPSNVRCWVFLALLLSSPSVLAQSGPFKDNSVLLYGFEPFGTFDVNPSSSLAQRFANKESSRHAGVLPVSPPEALGALFKLMERKPRFIIGFGVRADVEGFEVNVEATNWISMRTPGELPFFGSIEAGLPSALGLREAWLERITEVVKAIGGEAHLSTDSGMHACNLTFFQALLHAEARTRVVFIHVPPDVLERKGLLRGIERLIDALTKG